MKFLTDFIFENYDEAVDFHKEIFKLGNKKRLCNLW